MVTVHREAINKAFQYVGSEKMKKNLATNPNSKTGRYEYGHKAAISPAPQFRNYLFIVGKEMDFVNNQKTDDNWVVYAFDLDGNFQKQIEPFDLTGYFFRDLIYIN